MHFRFITMNLTLRTVYDRVSADRDGNGTVCLWLFAETGGALAYNGVTPNYRFARRHRRWADGGGRFASSGGRITTIVSGSILTQSTGGGVGRAGFGNCVTGGLSSDASVFPEKSTILGRTAICRFKGGRATRFRNSSAIWSDCGAVWWDHGAMTWDYGTIPVLNGARASYRAACGVLHFTRGTG
jgi:hypothetical protein